MEKIRFIEESFDSFQMKQCIITGNQFFIIYMRFYSFISENILLEPQ